MRQSMLNEHQIRICHGVGENPKPTIWIKSEKKRKSQGMLVHFMQSCGFRKCSEEFIDLSPDLLYNLETKRMMKSQL